MDQFVVGFKSSALLWDAGTNIGRHFPSPAPLKTRRFPDADGTLTSMSSTDLLVKRFATSWQSSVLRPQCRLSLNSPRPGQRVRTATQSSRGKGKKKTEPKKKARPDYVLEDLRKAEQFSLCDAMRYVTHDLLHRVVLY